MRLSSAIKIFNLISSSVVVVVWTYHMNPSYTIDVMACLLIGLEVGLLSSDNRGPAGAFPGAAGPCERTVSEREEANLPIDSEPESEDLAARPPVLVSAGSKIQDAIDAATPGDLIIVAARCNDGFPVHGNFQRFLFDYDGPQAFLDALFSPGFAQQDQWQNQLLALIQLKARIAVFSELEPAELIKAHMQPIQS